MIEKEENRTVHNNESQTTTSQSAPEQNNKRKKTMKRIIMFIVIVIIIILLLLLRSCSSCSGHGGSKSTGNPPLTIETENKWDGTSQENTEEIVTEYIEIPGYSNLAVSKKTQTIHLGNPEKNTVYLQYQIVEGDEVIYETNAIKPGNMVDANLYELLSPGEHDVKFVINTYDIETESSCNGAIQDVTITKME